ncbi:MAG: hypothetical protein LBC43_02105 [Bifidobacteriaceae bacterium]|jgi:hypothetical protein|nr:hypothetical protein [Bifidobacteriaceae bacterium]
MEFDFDAMMQYLSGNPSFEDLNYFERMRYDLIHPEIQINMGVMALVRLTDEGR